MGVHKGNTDMISSEAETPVPISQPVPISELEEEQHVHFKTILVEIAGCFLFFASVIGLVGSGYFAQSISKVFNASTESQWLGPILAILTAILNLPLAQAADYWGRKWILVSTTSLGFVGCLIISRAQSMTTVIVGTCFLGVSYGNQSSLLAVVSEVVPRKHRPFAQTSANACGGLGQIFGLALGGGLVRYGHLENYRIYFYVEAAIFGIAALAFLLCYNPPLRELQASLSTMEKLKRLDWIGYVLFSPGLLLFCMALVWSKNPYDLKNAHILATFIVGVVLLIIFIVYEHRFKRDGILHEDLFRSRNFNIAFLSLGIEGLSYLTTNNYFAYQISVEVGADPLLSNMHFAIVAFSIAFFSIPVAIYSARRKEIRLPLVAGFAGLLVFNILMATSTPRTSGSAFWSFPIISGFGLANILPLTVVLAQLSTPGDLIALASGLMVSSRGIGASIGLAINNAIFAGKLSTVLPSKITAAVLPLGLSPSSLPAFIGALSSQDTQALGNIPGVTPEIIGAGVSALKEAYSVSFRNVWILSTAFAALGLLCCLFVEDPKSEFNQHIDAPAEQSLVGNDGEKAFVENVEYRAEVVERI